MRVRLFERTTRQLRLTPEGERYLARCAPALEALAEAAAALVEEERGAVRGTLRMTATTGFGRQHVLPLLPEFMQCHPDLKLDLQLSDTFTDLVAEGFDLDIRGGILPENGYLVLRHVAAGRLELALTGYAVRTRGLYAVWPSRSHTPGKVGAFVQHLAEHFAERADLIFPSLS